MTKDKEALSKFPTTQEVMAFVGPHLPRSTMGLMSMAILSGCEWQMKKYGPLPESTQRAIRRIFEENERMLREGAESARTSSTRY